MPIASNVSLVTLKGQYVDYSGNAIAGQVKFRLPNATRNQIADQIIIPSTLSATLDNTGSFSTLLPATNDPDLVDAFTYSVEESFSGGRTYSLSLPVVAPSDRTNLVPNPSLETNATNWGVINASAAVRSTAQAAIGTTSYLLTANAAGILGPYVTATAGRIAVTAGQTYTGSMYVRDVNTSVQYRIGIEFYNSVTAGTSVGTFYGTATTVNSTGWTRISHTYTAPAGALGAVLTAYSVTTPAIGTQAYFDGALFEQSSTLNTYFDGSTNGINGTASWTGTAHASSSALDVDVRYNLCEESSFETSPTRWSGYYTSTRSVVTNQSAPFGSSAYSVTITNTGGGNNNGTIFLPDTVVPAGVTVTISAYIKGTAGRIVRFGGRPTNPDASYLTEDNGGTDVTMTGSWQRVSTSYTISNTSFRPGLQFYITPSNFVGTDTFYLDGVLIETGSTLGNYFDGSLSYGAWTGTAHGSTSTITRNLFDIADLAPAGTFPAYYAYVAYSSWAVLDASVQSMDAKIEQPLTAFVVASPDYSGQYGSVWWTYRTYDEIATYGTYNDIQTRLFFLGPDLARGNLISNPSFEVDTTGWLANTGGSIARSTANNFSGTASLLHTTTGAPGNGPFITSGYRPSATAGQSYTFSMYVQDINTSVTWTAVIQWYDAVTGGNFLSENVGTATAVNSSNWTRVSVTATAPVNAVAATLWLRSSTNPANGTQAYFDAALFEQSSTLGTYIEGDSWLVRHQTQATAAQASNATATVQLGIITAAYAERLDEMMIVGA